MKLEILMSCMHQVDDHLIRDSMIKGDVLMVNQGDLEKYEEYKTPNGVARILSTKQRGLTKSRNMAIDNAKGDICLLCDDDERFVNGYEKIIISSYQKFSQADIIVFKMVNRPPVTYKARRIYFPFTLKVSSWQISFKRSVINQAGIRFDTNLGAGTGNGGEEELKFLLECQKAGLKIYSVPEEIAEVAQNQSTWFNGFTQEFFENRGATTRYILGFGMASIYAVYYLIFKYSKYKNHITFFQATRAIFRGIVENKIVRKNVSGGGKA